MTSENVKHKGFYSWLSKAMEILSKTKHYNYVEICIETGPKFVTVNVIMSIDYGAYGNVLLV